ncbi:MAG: hypothetical protein MJ070_08495 [Lachnospiraceae bacterium]|nr:hypothetical protein [Lachnospiraceae bacterium]
MKGKQRCKILKEIRKKIAEENDIAFVTSECKHQGDCLGTCPKCEAELQYLEKELDKKKKSGLKTAVVGISAGITAAVTLTGTSCAAFPGGNSGSGQELMGDMLVKESEKEVVQPEGEIVEVDGDIPIPGEIVVPESEEETKEPADSGTEETEETEEEFPLMGAPEYEPPEMGVMEIPEDELPTKE